VRGPSELDADLLGSYREVPGNFEITGNTLAPAPRKFIAPWLIRAAEEFRHVEAAWSGVVVELVLFCQLYDDSMWSFSPMNIRNSVIGIGDGGPHGEEWTLRSARLD